MRHLAAAGAILFALVMLAAPAHADDAGVHAFFRRAAVGTSEPVRAADRVFARPGHPRDLRPDRAGMADIVLATARRHGVPAALAYGVAFVESRFDPRARSKAGAIGLMQVMPATARGLGCRGSLAEPRANADCGMRYLARLLARTRGDERLAAALYNVGEAGNPRAGARYAALVMARARGMS